MANKSNDRNAFFFHKPHPPYTWVTGTIFHVKNFSDGLNFRVYFPGGLLGPTMKKLGH